MTIEANFYDNNRYDVGLWCDAVQGLKERFAEFVLLNDSIFALRSYDGMLETRRSNRTLLAVSLMYNARNKQNKQNKTGIWTESFFRGFNSKGLDLFMDHSCVPSDHRSFGRKRSIVKYHEIGLSYSQFSEEQVKGVYDGDPSKIVGQPMWSARPTHWREILLTVQNFPAAKVKGEMIPTLDDPLLHSCTKHLDLSEMKKDLCESLIMTENLSPKAINSFWEMPQKNNMLLCQLFFLSCCVSYSF